MVWPRVKEGRGGYHQEDVKHASARKEKIGEAQEKMVGQYHMENMKEYNMTEDMAQNRSGWHVKIKAGPLLHGGGLQVRR